MDAQQVNAQVDQDIEAEGGEGHALGHSPAQEELKQDAVGHAQHQGTIQGQRNHCVEENQDIQVKRVQPSWRDVAVTRKENRIV